MIYKIKKEMNIFYIFKNSNKFETPNKMPLKANSKKHANILLKEIGKKKNDPYSILNLTLFSCNLTNKDRNDINLKLIEILKNDFVLFRDFNDIDLIMEMERSFKKLIADFGQKFNINLFIKTNLTEINNIKISSKLENWLSNLDNEGITVLYKIASLSNSLILSYFFIKKKISCKTFFKLVNIEYDYQQKKWGILEEHKKNNIYISKIIENIYNFLIITNANSHESY